MSRDWEKCMIVAPLIAVSALMVITMVGIFQVQHTCQRTDDTRFSTRIMPVGKVMVPMTVTETRYVCSDGQEVWL